MASLPKLYRIQELESAITGLNQLEQQTKRDPSWVALKKSQKELKSAIENVENNLAETKSKAHKLELDLKNFQMHHQDEETKLYSGNVSSPRELEQIQLKMLEYQNAARKVEDELLVVLEVDEKQTVELETIKQQLEQCTQELKAVEKGLRQKLLEISMERDDYQAELETLTTQVPQEWLEKYRKVADTHKGIGIAKVKKNSCGACHITLSEALMSDIKRGEDQLLYCENCGRILYY
ncbi:MAG TPA: C4-type zinc ribbon domain-containing protein [Bacillota bacterium]|nr:C4-type zinc ribbon domain-containing protein [Bacillota bacterium]HOL11038.1 C4-type zinc ribbon domain-containing protein [Bacillota bacterium]HPO98923.1 C4-type zinc ribbon domain-containing protein [Bacillota bacterium]